MIELKKQLYQTCQQHVEMRMATAQEAMDAAIAAGNEETKSSAGDKYETGRAMMQMEQDRFRKQLMEIRLLKAELQQIKPEKKSKKVTLGSLVSTNHGNFFIAIGLGKIKIEGQTYYIVSAASPIAKAMFHKQEETLVLFQNRQYIIEHIT